MTTQHTPAPWDTCRTDGWCVNFDWKGEGTVEAHAVCDANGKIIAFAVDHADSAFANLNTDHANLIAAAPELLEALKAMVDAYRHHDGLGADLEFEPWTKAALDAIFKATGAHHE